MSKIEKLIEDMKNLNLDHIESINKDDIENEIKIVEKELNSNSSIPKEDLQSLLKSLKAELKDI